MRQEIYNALFSEKKEVELSKMEVELASINELKAALKEGDKSLKAVRGASTQFEEARRELIKGLGTANSAIKQLTGVSDAFASAAKALGLSADSVKEYNEVQDRITTMKNFVNNYEKQLK